jgi:hypothetical protein
MSTKQLSLGAKLAGQGVADTLLKAMPATLMLLRVKVALPTLVRRTLRAGKLPVRDCVPKSNAAGVNDRLAVGEATPAPVRARVTSPLLALDLMVKAALRAPNTVGWNVSNRVHCWPDASTLVLLHVPARLKSPGAEPLRLMSDKIKFEPPVFCTLMVCGLLLPNCVLGNSAEKALNSMRAWAKVVVVPLSVKLWGPLAALCVMARPALLVPAAAGVY